MSTYRPMNSIGAPGMYQDPQGSHPPGYMQGYPGYNGYEYDPEVADNMVVASPGGASTTHHHYTKGVYGVGASTRDIYAGQGDRYPHAEYGNIYQGGPTAAQYMGQYPAEPDYPYYPDSAPSTSAPAKTEKFKQTSIDNFEFIDADKKDGTGNVVTVANPLLLLLIVIMAYVALEYWTEASEMAISSFFFKGKEMGIKTRIAVAAVLTIVILIMAYYIKIPIVTIEKAL